MITLGELMMPLELHRQGLPLTEITRLLGLDRKSVRRHIAKGLELPAYGPRVRRSKGVGPFFPYLRERLAAYTGLTAVRL